MADTEKVIKGLELCGYMEGMPQCDSCPYDGKQCWKRLKNDALALLKAQEPKRGQWICRDYPSKECSECHWKHSAMRRYRYCPNCGARMDGEDNG